MSGPAARRALPVMPVAPWLLAGVPGALAFWLVQVLAGEGTIPQFMGEQIATTVGYTGLALGWVTTLIAPRPSA